MFFFCRQRSCFFFRVIVTRLNRFRSRNYSDNSGGDGGGYGNDGGNDKDDTVYRGSGADAQLIILISSITTPPAI